MGLVDSNRTHPSGTVAVVASLWSEVEPTVARFAMRSDDTSFYSGQFGDQRLVLVLTGVGADLACRRVERLLDEENPDRLILIGFAGGLDPTLVVGEVIDVQDVIDTNSAAVWIDSQGYGFESDDPIPRGRGVLLTVDHLVSDIHEKRALHEQYAAAAVDMESFHVAQLAARRSVPLKIIRAISDTADTVLPGESSAWTRPDGRTDVFSVIRFLTLRPWRLPAVIRLGRNASVAAKALALHLERTLREIA